MTDAVRERFERWMTEDGTWPAAVEKRAGAYLLAQTRSSWVAWQAAIAYDPWRPLGLTLEAALNRGEDPALLMDENSPLRDELRRLLAGQSETSGYRCAECKAPLLPGHDCGVCGSFAAEEAGEPDAHPAPVERAALTDARLIELHASVDWGIRGCALTFARAVIAEYERINGITPAQTDGCRAEQIGPDRWVCDCGGPPCITPAQVEQP